MFKKCLISLMGALLIIPFFFNQDTLAIDNIGSRCGVLMEQLTGRVLYEKCADDQMYIASITKIMTAIVAIENGNLDEWVEITREDTYQVGSSLYMVEGDKMLMRDLLYGLMLRSGNDAAWAIARHIGGDVDTFVTMMNDKAYEIGMKNSVFQNPSGLDETTFNLSSARDMALIQRYAMNNPYYREISSQSFHRATSEQGKVFTWKNKHQLVNGRYQYTVSGKTGFTKRAKRTLVTSANNGDLELVAVTLVGANDWGDHVSMFEYGFENFNMKNAVDIGELHLLEDEMLYLVGFDRLFVRESRAIVLGEDEHLSNQLILRDNYDGTNVGVLEILVNDEVVDSVEVFAFQALPELNWWQRVLSWLRGN